MSTVERLVAAMNAHDPEALGWCYAPDATVWPTGWPAAMPASEWLAAAPVIYERFPDLAIEAQSTVADGDRCAIELRMTGTDQTTGEPLLGDGVVLVETRDDLVVRERHYWLYAAVPAPVTA
jgi:ketosteroid isomerase-like protein